MQRDAGLVSEASAMHCLSGIDQASAGAYGCAHCYVGVATSSFDHVRPIQQAPTDTSSPSTSAAGPAGTLSSPSKSPENIHTSLGPVADSVAERATTAKPLNTAQAARQHATASAEKFTDVTNATVCSAIGRSTCAADGAAGYSEPAVTCSEAVDLPPALHNLLNTAKGQPLPLPLSLSTRLPSPLPLLLDREPSPNAAAAAAAAAEAAAAAGMVWLEAQLAAARGLHGGGAPEPAATSADVVDADSAPRSVPLQKAAAGVSGPLLPIAAGGSQAVAAVAAAAVPAASAVAAAPAASCGPIRPTPVRWSGQAAGGSGPAGCPAGTEQGRFGVDRPAAAGIYATGAGAEVSDKGVVAGAEVADRSAEAAGYKPTAGAAAELSVPPEPGLQQQQQQLLQQQQQQRASFESSDSSNGHHSGLAGCVLSGANAGGSNAGAAAGTAAGPAMRAVATGVGASGCGPAALRPQHALPLLPSFPVPLPFGALDGAVLRQSIFEPQSQRCQQQQQQQQAQVSCVPEAAPTAPVLHEWMPPPWNAFPFPLPMPLWHMPLPLQPPQPPPLPEQAGLAPTLPSTAAPPQQQQQQPQRQQQPREDQQRERQDQREQQGNVAGLPAAPHRSRDGPSVDPRSTERDPKPPPRPLEAAQTCDSLPLPAAAAACTAGAALSPTSHAALAQGATAACAQPSSCVAGLETRSRTAGLVLCPGALSEQHATAGPRKAEGSLPSLQPQREVHAREPQSQPQPQPGQPASTAAAAAAVGVCGPHGLQPPPAGCCPGAGAASGPDLSSQPHPAEDTARTTGVPGAAREQQQQRRGKQRPHVAESCGLAEGPPPRGAAPPPQPVPLPVSPQPHLQPPPPPQQQQQQAQQHQAQQQPSGRLPHGAGAGTAAPRGGPRAAAEGGYKYIVQVGDKWRAQVGATEGGLQRKYYSGYVRSAAQAARDADKLLYKLRGPNFPLNFPLLEAERQLLDSTPLQDLLQQLHPAQDASALAAAAALLDLSRPADPAPDAHPHQHTHPHSHPHPHPHPPAQAPARNPVRHDTVGAPHTAPPESPNAGPCGKHAAAPLGAADGAPGWAVLPPHAVAGSAGAAAAEHGMGSAAGASTPAQPSAVAVASTLGPAPCRCGGGGGVATGADAEQGSGGCANPNGHSADSSYGTIGPAAATERHGAAAEHVATSGAGGGVTVAAAGGDGSGEGACAAANIKTHAAVPPLEREPCTVQAAALPTHGSCHAAGAAAGPAAGPPAAVVAGMDPDGSSTPLPGASDATGGDGSTCAAGIGVAIGGMEVDSRGAVAAMVTAGQAGAGAACPGASVEHDLSTQGPMGAAAAYCHSFAAAAAAAAAASGNMPHPSFGFPFPLGFPFPFSMPVPPPMPPPVAFQMAAAAAAAAAASQAQSRPQSPPGAEHAVGPAPWAGAGAYWWPPHDPDKASQQPPACLPGPHALAQLMLPPHVFPWQPPQPPPHPLAAQGHGPGGGVLPALVRFPMPAGGQALPLPQARPPAEVPTERESGACGQEQAWAESATAAAAAGALTAPHLSRQTPQPPPCSRQLPHPAQPQSPQPLPQQVQRQQQQQQQQHAQQPQRQRQGRAGGGAARAPGRAPGSRGAKLPPRKRKVAALAGSRSGSGSGTGSGSGNSRAGSDVEGHPVTAAAPASAMAAPPRAAPRAIPTPAAASGRREGGNHVLLARPPVPPPLPQQQQPVTSYLQAAIAGALSPSLPQAAAGAAGDLHGAARRPAAAAAAADHRPGEGHRAEPRRAPQQHHPYRAPAGRQQRLHHAATGPGAPGAAGAPRANGPLAGLHGGPAHGQARGCGRGPADAPEQSLARGAETPAPAGEGAGAGASVAGRETADAAGPAAPERPPFRYIVRIGSKWRAQVGHTEDGVQRKYYSNYVDDPRVAAKDADRILYKLRGAGAVANLLLSEAERAALDGLSLEALMRSFKSEQRGGALAQQAR